ncbi:MAG TPA: hydantoinase B/oxoprolinase family protein [Hyphomicrobiaceae bacterium]|jgi:N-methylhydantoinase B|nr:hydantoinase B/oxoprolinase family protein [Hyphomicrobiaceae bacterium]
MHSQPISPIALSVIWNGFLSIAEEMGTTLQMTAFSEAVREGQDFSTAIFDSRGRLVAQGNFTPGHLGSMPYVIKSIMEIFPPGALKPGDGVLLNDSKLGSGHYPDFFFVSPVFLESTLIGYLINTAHHIDVGGAAPGSQKVQGISERFQEGLRILPVRVLRGGEFDEDILRLILGNVRLPEILRGDLTAQRNANFVGAQRLAKLYQEHGPELIARAIDEILDRSEARMRELIRAIPDGRYSAEDWLDACGEECGPIKVAVDIDVAGDEITVDFSRSSDQVPVALNSYINYTRAYTLFSIKVFTDALLPQNGGMIRPIHVKAREGSFFNPREPAPSGGRAIIQIRIFEVINGALAQALPDKAFSAFSHWSNPNIGGLDPRTDKPFVMYDLMFGGYGARAGHDGAEALSPVVNCANIPVEVHETINPVLVRRFELIADSGGAGRWRGGCGIRKDIELKAETAVMTLLGERHSHPGSALAGGEPGSLASTTVLSGNERVEMGSKDVRALKRGDVVSFRLNGGAGWGQARERDPDRVADDVAEGYVSAEAAKRVYGWRGA